LGFALELAFIGALILGAVIVLELVAACPLHAADKPNILVLFADDQCFETIGALGMTNI
jgi:hypothetical protein